MITRGELARTVLFVLTLLALSAARSTVTFAQRAAPTIDTLRLGALQSDAIRHDPRGRELELLAAQSALRLRSIGAARLPTLSLNGQTQYQSDVASIPIKLPGVNLPIPPHDTYDAHIDARQRIFDPTTAGRRSTERAQLSESQARVRTALYALRQSVNDVYFSVLLLQSQQAEFESSVNDLDVRLRVARDRVAQGVTLPSEAAIIEAELLRRRQSLGELSVNRYAALVVLSDLTGHDVSAGAALSLPDMTADVARARAALESIRVRPEYDQFARSRDVLEQQRASRSAADLPRVFAFGRAGYGRPGLNPLAKDFVGYWIAGVQFEWTPWNWGSTRRDREVLSLQKQIVDSYEAAFTESLSRDVVRDLAAIDRLDNALAEDDAIIALREQVLHETRLRYGEGVITSADYVDRQTDAVSARIARISHSVELSQARARFLTSLGLEVR